MRRENNRVFLLAMWMMFFAVSAFGQDSGLLNRYRSMFGKRREVSLSCGGAFRTGDEG